MKQLTEATPGEFVCTHCAFKINGVIARREIIKVNCKNVRIMIFLSRNTVAIRLHRPYKYIDTGVLPGVANYSRGIRLMLLNRSYKIPKGLSSPFE